MRRVAHAVNQQVTHRSHREATQADVLVGAVFSGGEGNACGVVQRLFQRVKLAVIEQFFRDDRDGLWNVPEFLLALADAGGLGLQGFFTLRRFSFFLDHDGVQGFVRCRGGRLCPAADRCCQHQRAQRQQGAFSGQAGLSWREPGCVVNAEFCGARSASEKVCQEKSSMLARAVGIGPGLSK